MSATIQPAGRTGQVTANGARGDFRFHTLVPDGEYKVGSAGALRVFRVSATRILGAVHLEFTGAASLTGTAVAMREGTDGSSLGLGVHVFPNDSAGPNSLTYSSYINGCRRPNGSS